MVSRLSVGSIGSMFAEGLCCCESSMARGCSTDEVVDEAQLRLAEETTTSQKLVIVSSPLARCPRKEQARKAGNGYRGLS